MNNEIILTVAEKNFVVTREQMQKVSQRENQILREQIPSYMGEGDIEFDKNLLASTIEDYPNEKEIDLTALNLEGNNLIYFDIIVNDYIHNINNLDVFTSRMMEQKLNFKSCLELLKLADYLGMIHLKDYLINIIGKHLRTLKGIESMNVNSLNNTNPFVSKESVKETFLTINQTRKINEYLQDIGIVPLDRSTIIIRSIRPDDLAIECQKKSIDLDICQLSNQTICRNLFKFYNFNLDDYMSGLDMLPCDIMVLLLDYARQKDKKIKDIILNLTEDNIKNAAIMMHAFQSDNLELLTFLIKSKYFRILTSGENMKDEIIFYRGSSLNEITLSDILNQCMLWYSRKISEYIIEKCNKKPDGRQLVYLLSNMDNYYENPDQKFIEYIMSRSEALTMYQIYLLGQIIKFGSKSNKKGDYVNMIKNIAAKFPMHINLSNMLRMSKYTDEEMNNIYNNFLETHILSQEEKQQMKNTNVKSQLEFLTNRMIRGIYVGKPKEVDDGDIKKCF